MIRLYEKEDKAALLNILSLNIPEYFEASEIKDFIHYLDNDSAHFFVYETNDIILAAGGYNLAVDGTGTARISWDFVHPEMKGKGIGTAIVDYSLKALKKDSELQLIIVRTSQLAHTFYSKFGFKLLRTEKDYWADGFDLYYMELRLS